MGFMDLTGLTIGNIYILSQGLTLKEIMEGFK